MSAKSSDRGQAAQAASSKEERARDAALAVREYEAQRLALQANTARLRALRLAKEASERDAAAAPKADQRRKAKR